MSQKPAAESLALRLRLKRFRPWDPGGDPVPARLRRLEPRLEGAPDNPVFRMALYRCRMDAATSILGLIALNLLGFAAHSLTQKGLGMMLVVIPVVVCIQRLRLPSFRPASMFMRGEFFRYAADLSHAGLPPGTIVRGLVSAAADGRSLRLRMMEDVLMAAEILCLAAWVPFGGNIGLAALLGLVAHDLTAYLTAPWDSLPLLARSIRAARRRAPLHFDPELRRKRKTKRLFLMAGLYAGAVVATPLILVQLLLNSPEWVRRAFYSAMIALEDPADPFWLGFFMLISVLAGALFALARGLWIQANRERLFARAERETERLMERLHALLIDNPKDLDPSKVAVQL